MQAKKVGHIVVTTLLLVLAGMSVESAAQVNVNVNIGPPPVYVVPAPPPVVVIPGTYVYMVPNIEVDILFYHGYWYRPHGAYWYRARSYNGPWVYLAPPQVPRALMTLPPGYHRVPPGYAHIPYGQMKKNWAKWEQEKYWEKDKAWHEPWHGQPEGKGGDRGPQVYGEPHGKGNGGQGKGHGGQGHGGH